jgi:isopenicillin N synthase-like dioxygenase
MAQATATMIEPTDDARAIDLMNNPDSVEEIPIIDMGAYLAGKAGADRQMADELREVTETVGFFYLKNHSVPQSLIDRMFAESKRFFAQPIEEKRKIPRVDNFGYVEMKEPLKHKGNEHLIKTVKPALNESFLVGRERSADDPDVNKIFRRINTWPENLPGFRETLLEYHATIEALGRKFLPLWAKSLDLPGNFFEPYFKVPHVNLRLAHYPPQDEIGSGQYGINPHTDNCLMTFLAQANVPGLAVQMPSGHWRRVDHSRHAADQHRQSDAALDQRALQVDQARRHQHRRRRPLFVPGVLRPELRCADRMSADLLRPGPPRALRADHL